MAIYIKRLIIRPYSLKDFRAWQRAYSQSKNSSNAWDLKPKTLNELTRELIGTVSLMDISRGVFQNAYLGYRIFSPYWKNGFGRESVEALIQFGFKRLKLHRIEAGIEPSNRRSILLARSLDMRKEGLKRRALYLKKRWTDIVMYSLTCEDMGLKFIGSTKKLSVRIR